MLKNVLILLGYSVCYRLWVGLFDMGYGIILPLLSMAIAVGLHALILVSLAIDRRSRDHALAAVVVALVGFGVCSIGTPL